MLFQAMNDERASFRRFLKYVVPVITFSFAFNIPKFMEAEIIYNANYSATHDPNEPILSVSDLRRNPDYTIYYNNWTRIAFLGIIPTALLIFFNTKIYQDVRVSNHQKATKS